MKEFAIHINYLFLNEIFGGRAINNNFCFSENCKQNRLTNKGIHCRILMDSAFIKCL